MAQDNRSSAGYYREFFAESTYGRWFHNDERIDMVLALVDGLGLGRTARILEVGGGAGDVTWRLLQRFEAVHVIDLGQYPAMGKLCRAEPRRVRFTTGSGAALPFAGGLFDAVIFSEVIEHMDPRDQWLALREIRRVLRPRGVLVLSTPNPRAITLLHRRVLGALKIRRPYHASQLRENWLVPARVQRWLRGAGLTVRQKRGSYFIPFVTHLPRWLQSGLLHVSCSIGRRGMLPDRGLYQYYVAGE